MFNRKRTALLLALLCAASSARADTIVTPTHVTPQSTAALGLVTSVVVSGPGLGASMHGASITTGAVAGFFLILNAAADPGNGAVTPVKCIQVAASSTTGVSADPDTMWDFPKGLVFVFSSTGCLIETQSPTAFFSWQ